MLLNVYVKCCIPVEGLIDITVVVPDLMVSAIAPEPATYESSMSVALKLGELTYDCAVRLDTIRFVDEVTIFCFVASRMSVSVFVYVVA